MMAYQAAPLSGNRTNAASTSTSTSKDQNGHAISRSAELLSCARTALKIRQQEHPDDPRVMALSPSQLTLHNGENNSSNQIRNSMSFALEDDAQKLLQAMKECIETLQGLVRRRGHTNDPTEQIGVTVKRFEEYAKELATVVQSIRLLGKGRQQPRKHYELVSDRLKANASECTAQFKQVLEVRGNVIKDQARRRRMLHPSNSASNSTSSTTGTISSRASAALGAKQAIASTSTAKTTRSHKNTPLFTAAPLSSSSASSRAAVASSTVTAGTNSSSSAANGYNPYRQQQQQPQQIMNEKGSFQYGNNSMSMNNSSHHSNGSAVAPAGYGGYGGAAASASASGGGGYGGYGGGGGAVSYYGAPASGMRQRKSNHSATSSNSQQQQQQQQQSYEQDVQMQIQERQQKRETKGRLESARQAEKTLAELGTLFGKMTNLIQTQGETLEKIEDDVESAFVDVSAGQEEVVKLYHITKGNRGLILKVFGFLIFMIIFMRLYRR